MQLRRKKALSASFFSYVTLYKSFLNPVITQKYTMRRMMENTAS